MACGRSGPQPRGRFAALGRPRHPIHQFTIDRALERYNRIDSLVFVGEDILYAADMPALRMDFLDLQTICLSFLSEVGSLEINIALTEGQ